MDLDQAQIIIGLQYQTNRYERPTKHCKGKKAQIEKLEDATRAAIGELKTAQKSLRKAIENCRPNVAEPYQVSDHIMQSTSEPTKDDIEGMLKAVLTGTKSNIFARLQMIATIKSVWKKRTVTKTKPQPF